MAEALPLLDVQQNSEVLHPNALTFLRYVYGPDRRIESLPPTDAEAVTEQLLLVTSNYAEAEPTHASPPGDYLTTPQEAEEAEWEQQRWKRTVCAVRSFVSGETLEEVAQSAGYDDAINVGIDLVDVAVGLRGIDKRLGEASEGSPSILEDVLQPYIEPWQDYPGSEDLPPPRHMIPIGCTATGEIEQHDSQKLIDEMVEEHTNHSAELVWGRVHEYALTPEFIEAAARKGHDKDAEIFVICPEDTDEDSEVLRKMAVLVTTAVFAEKDGDGEDDVLYNSDPEQDYFELAVSHVSGQPEPTGAMYAKHQTASGRLPSLEDIQGIWGVPVLKTLHRAGLPNLRYHPNVMDVLTIGVVPEHRNTSVGFALYNAFAKLCKKLNVKYLVTVYDEYAVDQFNQHAVGFRPYASDDIIPPKNYHARRKGANKSRPYWCDLDQWEKDLLSLVDSKGNPNHKPYNFFWGDTLASRFQVTNLWKGRLPLKVEEGSLLSPEHIFGQLAEERPIIYMDKSVITEKYNELKASLPGVEVCYAMKCNSDQPVLEHIQGLGGNFEIASVTELTKLIEIGVRPADVLFSNPVKSESQIRAAYKAGVRCFAFQGPNELDKLARCAPGANAYFRAATSKGASTVASESKFGARIDTPEGRLEAFMLIKSVSSKGPKPYGIAFHVGSQMEDPRAWDKPLEDAGLLMEMLENKGGIRLSMLDMGGGFPAAGHNARVPSLAAFGKSITKQLKKLPYQPDRIVIEPGRALVSDAGVTRVEVYGKEFRDGRWWLYTSVGAFNGMMEALETGTKMGYPMADSRGSRQLQRFAVSGPSCDGQDLITDSQWLSAGIQVGDYVLIYSTGAYTKEYAAPFNGFETPAIRYVGETSDPLQRQRRFAKLLGQLWHWSGAVAGKRPVPRRQ